MGVRIVAAVLTVLAVAVPVAAAAAPFNTSQFYTQTEFERAIKPYTDAIARNPNDADAHYWLGVAYLHAYRLARMGLAPYASGFAPRVEASLTRALQLRPGMLGALVALLEFYSISGNDVKWAATLDRLIALNQPLPLK
ncbi:MAG TPA: tetratricopeptide repeat protein [bacterium]|nr:tetratricopeptide repeat protein [bacterium]